MPRFLEMCGREIFLLGRKILNRAWFHSTCVRTYIPLHSTSQSGVEQILSSTTKMIFTPLTYVPTYKCTLHSTCVRTYVRMYFPLHSTSQNGVEQKKSMNSYKKPGTEKITRRWKSQMLKISPDAEKARHWKNRQMLKNHQIYSP